jgi:hypothetical protein
VALSRDSRQEQKLKALRMAQFRLKQRFEMIDWREDILLPEIEAMKAGKSVLGLPDGAAFDIRVRGADENRDRSAGPSPEQPGSHPHRPARSRRRAPSAAGA